jgi:hypothetical protein
VDGCRKARSVKLPAWPALQPCDASLDASPCLQTPSPRRRRLRSGGLWRSWTCVQLPSFLQLCTLPPLSHGSRRLRPALRLYIVQTRTAGASRCLPRRPRPLLRSSLGFNNSGGSTRSTSRPQCAPPWQPSKGRLHARCVIPHLTTHVRLRWCRERRLRQICLLGVVCLDTRVSLTQRGVAPHRPRAHQHAALALALAAAAAREAAAAAAKHGWLFKVAPDTDSEENGSGTDSDSEW